MNDVVAVAFDGVWFALFLAAPVLVGVWAAGVVFSLVQATFQLQDGGFTFVPRLIVGMVLLVLLAPWLGAEWMSYASSTFPLLTEVAR